MFQPKIQDFLDEDIEVLAQFQGPIHQSKKDLFLVLTASKAIAIFTLASDSSQQQKIEMLTIPRTKLSFAQRQDFPRTHLLGFGGRQFGTYIDGFSVPLTISSSLSFDQQQALDALRIEWGGEVKLICRAEAEERHQASFEKQSILLGLFMLIVWLPFFLLDGISRSYRLIRNWLRRNKT